MNNECSKRLKMLSREMGDEVRGRLSLGWTLSPAYPGRLGVAGSVLIAIHKKDLFMVPFT